MKKNTFGLFAVILISIATNILLSSSSNGRAFAGNSGNTGAPGEPQTCRSCHGAGFGTTVNLVVKNSAGFPITSYTPGNTYEVEVSVNTSSGNPQRYGFQLVSLLPGNAAFNSWSNPSSNTRIASAGPRTYAEHSGKSLTSSFTVDWTAPSIGSGTVNFYAGGAAVNNNGGTSGDGGNTTSLSITEGSSTGINNIAGIAELKYYPNPAKDELNIAFETENSFLIVRILDTKGSLVLEEQIRSNYMINLRDLNAGLYFIQFQSETGSMLTERLLIQ